jgi:iron complex outermembrane recepter protein
MKMISFSVAAALAMTTALSSAHAAEDATMLEKVTVTAEAPAEATTAPSIAASQEALRQIPGSTAVVAKEAYEDSRAATIKDMLDYTPGVFAQSRVNEESRLSIRGSGLSRTFHMRGLNLYQDGIPIHMADGASDFQDIDPLALSHVEVYKGANALHLGSATLGGAINFITPTGYNADPFSLRLEAGSFGTRRGHVSTGDVMGNSDYFMSFTKQVSDGFREHSRQNNARLHTNLGHRFNDRLETRFYLTYVDANQELPGSITKAQLYGDRRQANAGSASNNYQRDYEMLRLANKTTWLGDDYTLNGGVYTIQKDLYHPIFQIIDQRNREYGLFANAEFMGEVAGLDNTFLLGTDMRMGQTDSKRFVNSSGGYGAETANSDDKSTNLTLYAEDRLKLNDAFTLIGGAQFLYARRGFEDTFLGNGDQSDVKEYYGLSPKIGAIWQVQPEVQLYTNVSASYEPPTFSELTQNLPGVVTLAPIDAQKAYTWEVGTRGEHKSWNWDAAAYRAWLKDELMMFATSATTSGVTNADDTYHQGVELAAGYRFDSNWSTRMAYTWSDFHFDGDAQWGDNEIPGMPEHYLRAELRYDGGGWYVAPNIEASLKDYYVDMENTLEAEAYALLGLTAGVDVTERVSLFFDARNLTDETYAATTNVITSPTATNTAVYLPGDGRSFYAGLRYRW